MNISSNLGLRESRTVLPLAQRAISDADLNSHTRLSGLSYLTVLVMLIGTCVLGCKPEKPTVDTALQQEAAKRAEEAIVAADGNQSKTPTSGQESGITPEQSALIVARIGNHAITLGDVSRHLAGLAPGLRTRYGTLEKRKELLDDMVNLELLTSEAKKRGLEKDAQVQHALKEALARELMRTAVDTTVSMSSISEDDVNTYYNENKADFVSQEQRRAAKITFDSEEAAQKTHAKLRSAIAESPKLARQVFGDFAREKSIDMETKARKGDMAWFDRQGMNQKRQKRVSGPILEHTFALTSLYEITKPFRHHERVWVVLQLTGKKDESIERLEKVRVKIKSKLLKKRQETARESFIASLKEGAKIELNPEALAALPAPERGKKGRRAKRGGKGMKPPHVKLPSKPWNKKAVGKQARGASALKIKPNRDRRLPSSKLQELKRRKRRESSESQQSSGQRQ